MREIQSLVWTCGGWLFGWPGFWSNLGTTLKQCCRSCCPELWLKLRRNLCQVCFLLLSQCCAAVSRSYLALWCLGLYFVGEPQKQSDPLHWLAGQALQDFWANCCSRLWCSCLTTPLIKIFDFYWRVFFIPFFGQATHLKHKLKLCIQFYLGWGFD